MMKRNSLLLLGLMMALILTACSALAAQPAPPPEAVPVSTIPPSDFVPLPPVESGAPVTETVEPVLEVPVSREEGGYFDNALFVGDSIMEGVRRYVAAQRQEGELLGSARFLTCSTGIALADLVGDRDRGLQFSYQGEERPLADIVKDIAPRRVFFLLGLNDLASEPDPALKDICDRYIRLVLGLREKFPGTEFIVIIDPPKAASQWLPDYTVNRHFGNELIGAFADELKAVCSEWDIPYMDAYEALKDENGALPNEFCSDGYVHLNSQGAAAVVEALEVYAEARRVG